MSKFSRSKRNKKKVDFKSLSEQSKPLLCHLTRFFYFKFHSKLLEFKGAKFSILEFESFNLPFQSSFKNLASDMTIYGSSLPPYRVNS